MVIIFSANYGLCFDAENENMSKEAKKFADDSDNFQKNNNFKEAENSLLAAIRYEPENPTLRTKLGIVYHANFELWRKDNLDNEDIDKAAVFNSTIAKSIKELEKAVALDPMDSVPRFFLGMEYKNAYEFTKDKEWLDKSELEFKKVLKFDPENMLAYHMLGVINYVNLNNPKEATGYFLRAVSIEPKFIESHIFLLNIYCDDGKTLLAREELEKIKLFDPKGKTLSKLSISDFEKRIAKIEKENKPSVK